MGRAVVDAVALGRVGRGRGRHDRRDEGLRVAVVERKPGALHLDHEPVPRLEGVVHMRERDRVLQGLVGGLSR